VAKASAGQYANLHLAPDTTMPASYESVFTDQMPFLLPTNSVKALKVITN